jgi:hypothetical protein
LRPFRRDSASNVIAELELSKDGDVGLQFVSRLRAVEIGCDQDGDPITSCVIEAVDAPAVAPKLAKGGRSDGVELIKRALTDAYARLSDGIEPCPGFDGAPVRKVAIDKLRDEVRSRGFLEISDTGAISPGARKQFQRAKLDLIASKRFIEADGAFWRLKVDASGGAESA